MKPSTMKLMNFKEKTCVGTQRKKASYKGLASYLAAFTFN